MRARSQQLFYHHNILVAIARLALLPLSHGFCTAERWHCVSTSQWNCQESPICKEKRVAKTVDDEWLTNWTNSLLLSTREKSSQLQIYVTFSTHESSFIIIFPINADTFASSCHKFKNSVMMEISYWQAMRHVQHLTAQTKKPVVQFGPLKQNCRSRIVA